MFACFADPTEWIATVRFLASGMPSDLLREGVRFELMEGSTRVAVGTIGSAVAPIGIPAGQDVGG
jgi:hypothetical protein